MRFTLTPTDDGRYYVLEDSETGATWPYEDVAAATQDRDRANKDPSYMRRRTNAERVED